MRLAPAALVLICAFSSNLVAQNTVTKYVRYSRGGTTSYGILAGDMIRELSGSLFTNPRETGRSVKLADVRLLAPCQPAKVIAVGLNYQSHLGTRAAAAYPGLFAKMPTSIIATGEDIVLPPTRRTRITRASLSS